MENIAETNCSLQVGQYYIFKIYLGNIDMYLILSLSLFLKFYNTRVTCYLDIGYCDKRLGCIIGCWLS